MEEYWEQNILVDVHQLFINFSRACDTVWRKEIWSEMHTLGFFPPQKKLVKLCRILNNEIYAKVKIGKHLSSELKIKKDLRQGDAVAPVLFNVVLKTAI